MARRDHEARPVQPAVGDQAVQPFGVGHDARSVLRRENDHDQDQACQDDGGTIERVDEKPRSPAFSSVGDPFEAVFGALSLPQDQSLADEGAEHQDGDHPKSRADCEPDEHESSPESRGSEGSADLREDRTADSADQSEPEHQSHAAFEGSGEKEMSDVKGRKRPQAGDGHRQPTSPGDRGRCDGQRRQDHQQGHEVVPRSGRREPDRDRQHEEKAHEGEPRHAGAKDRQQGTRDQRRESKDRCEDRPFGNDAHR